MKRYAFDAVTLSIGGAPVSFSSMSMTETKELPSTMDLDIRYERGEPQRLRVLRDVWPIPDADGGMRVDFPIVSGPRMRDGRWSPREALP